MIGGHGGDNVIEARAAPLVVLLLPNEGAEGLERAKPEPLIKPKRSVVEVCYSQGHLLVAQPMRFAKGEIKQLGSQSLRLEVRAYSHLGDMSGSAMDTRERHKASEFSRWDMVRHQARLRQRLPASSKVEDVVDQPRSPRGACVLVIDNGIDVAPVRAGN